MKTARIRSGLAALLVLLAATAACTNSEQLSSGVSPVPIEIMVIDSETRFDRAFIDVTQVTVRPLDPQASEVLGVNPLWMMKTTEDARFQINFNADQDRFETNSQLTIGHYEVLSIEMQGLEFREGERLGDATCGEYITDYPLIQFSVQLVDFGEPVTVEVAPGTGSQLQMVIDGAALAIAFSNSWKCFSGAPACGLFNPEPWCLAPGGPNAFEEHIFAGQASTFVSFP